MKVFFALLKKCVLRRCRSANGSSVPFGFILEVTVPLGFFYLFSWLASELDPVTVLPGIPGDTFSLDYYFPDVVPGKTPTFTEFLGFGYEPGFRPTCVNVPIPEDDPDSRDGPNDAGWNVVNKVTFLLDCTPTDRLAWASTGHVADQCTEEGQDVFESCQKKYIGLAPSDALKGSDLVASHLSSHATYLRNSFKKSIGAYDLIRVFASETAMVAYIEDPAYGVSLDPLAAGIVWNDLYPTYDYTIRMNSTDVLEQTEGVMDFDHYAKTPRETMGSCSGGRRGRGESDYGGTEIPDEMELGPCASKYANSRFVHIQTYMVDSFILESASIGKTGSPPDFHIRPNVGGFPYGGYTYNEFWSSVGEVFSTLLYLSFIMSFYNTIKQITEEKELKLSEGLKIMGVEDWEIAGSWWALFILQALVMSSLCMITAPSLFVHSSASIVFMFLFFYIISCTSFCIFIASFFSKARRAALLGFIIFFFGMVLPSMVPDDKFYKVIVSLCHPGSLFMYTTSAFVHFESYQIGVTSYTISEQYDVFGLTFSECLTLMICDTFIFALLTWYVSKVVPSDFGVALPPHFIFMPSYWKTGEIWATNKGGYSQVDSADVIVSTIEEVGDDLKRQESANECIQIKNLGKTYNTNNGEKVAVRNLDLTFYKGQISCLLGHNGAGKTTTINVLNGMTTPSSGSAKIGPHDVATGMASIRQDLGVCPQHDILFLTLTVDEHLRLFATIKKLDTSNLNQQIPRLLEEVGMPEKRYWRAASLSGGQKRKLSLAIAFLGDSSVVFLDEPTSGMDPYSRRSTWDLIKKKKEGRVIVLTTHFMDEADLLGDRIAIMSEGSLNCCGSSLFLKKEFGVGYNIVLEKKASGRADDNTIAKIIEKHIPSAEVLSSVGMEISYQLPLESSSKFFDMLSELDTNLSNLGLDSYGISVTTLEEVFLTIARGALKGDDDVSQQQQVTNQPSSTRIKMAHTKIDPSKWWLYVVRHCFALSTKRWKIQKRDYPTWAFSFIVPMLFVTLGMYGTMLAQSSQPIRSVALSVDQFHNSKTPLYHGDDGLSECLSIPISLACNPEWDEDDPTSYWDQCNYNEINSGFRTQVVDMGSRDSGGTAEMLAKFQDSTTVIKDNCTTSQHDQTMALGGDSLELIKVPSVGGIAPGVYDIAKVLHTTREDFKESRFGALFFPSTPLAPSGSVNHNSTFDGSDGGLNFFSSKFVEYVTMVNFTSFHAFPTFVNLANEMVVKSVDPEVSIKASSKPFPKTIVEVEVSDSEAVGGTIFVMLFALPFVPASFGNFAINERITKAKHIQILSGVSPFSYWFSSFLFDFANFCVSGAIMIGLLFAFQIDELTKSGTIEVVAGLLFSWGAAAAVFSYCQSFLFANSLSNFGFTMLLSMILGYMAGLVTYILGVIVLVWEPKDGRDPAEDYSTLDTMIDVEEVMAGIGHFIPTFNLAFGLLKIQNVQVISILNSMGQDVLSPWDPKIARHEVYWLLASTPIYFLLLLLIQFLSESPMLGGMIANLLQRNVNSYKEITDWDDDVVQENNRCNNIVNSQSPSSFPPILVNGLKKQYGIFNRFHREPKLAVRGVSFTVEPGVCFGLLGVNGAGKTSTLGMVSGEFPPSEGQAWLATKSIMSQARQVKRVIGYCPQFDAIFPLLTGREHLDFYARLKGVVESDLKGVVDEQIKRMDLVAHCERTVGGYSGGNKRKLSVACALVGDPKIVFLDEPSTGMDPLARRFMWSIVNQITKEKDTSVILTTHSMEECEALCSKIGIMVDGYFRCLGSGQHLKNKFGKGYQVEINAEDASLQGPSGAGVTSQTVDGILGYFQNTFPNFALLERQDNRIRISLSNLQRVDGHVLSIAALFGTIESVKAQLKIVDYSISQTTLEQIFNGFAKKQSFTSGTGTHQVPVSVVPVDQTINQGGYLPPSQSYLNTTQASPQTIEMVPMGAPLVPPSVQNVK